MTRQAHPRDRSHGRESGIGDGPEPLLTDRRVAAATVDQWRGQSIFWAGIELMGTPW